MDKGFSVHLQCGSSWAPETVSSQAHRKHSQNAPGIGLQKKPQNQTKKPNPTTNQNDALLLPHCQEKRVSWALACSYPRALWKKFKSKHCKPPHNFQVMKLTGPVFAPLTF